MSVTLPAFRFDSQGRFVPAPYACFAGTRRCAPRTHVVAVDDDDDDDEKESEEDDSEEGVTIEPLTVEDDDFFDENDFDDDFDDDFEEEYEELEADFKNDDDEKLPPVIEKDDDVELEEGDF